MNKAILLSIRPEHLVNILNGKKTLELRKTVPKDYKGWVYIYCTKNADNLIKVNDKYILEKGKRLNYDLNGKVVARFWFDEYKKIEYTISEFEDWPYPLVHSVYRFPIKLLNESCLTQNEVDDYSKGKNVYFWHIKQLEILDEPMELSEFYNDPNNPYVGRNEIKHAIEYYGKQKVREILKYTVERPPQSWQYVYVRDYV